MPEFPPVPIGDAPLPLTRDLFDALRADRDLGADMLAGYEPQFLADLARFDVEAVEVALTLPVRNPSSDRASQFFDRKCKIDVALREKSTGLLFLGDHKTYAPSRWSDVHNVLLLDRQGIGYYAAWEQVKGEQAAGFFWNVLLKRAAPIPPRIVQAKTAADRCACGRDLLGIDKKDKPIPHMISRAANQPTTGDLYRSTLAEHGIDPAGYADVIAAIEAALKTRYDRIVLARTENDVRDWAQDFYDLSREIRGATPTKHVSVMVCPRCPFLPLCLADTPEARQNYVVSETGHDEYDDDDEGEVRPGHDVLTYSRVAAYQQCRRREAYAYRERLRPKIEGRALRFGTGVHEALAAGYRSGDFAQIAAAWLAWWEKEFVAMFGMESKKAAAMFAGEEVGF